MKEDGAICVYPLVIEYTASQTGTSDSGVWSPRYNSSTCVGVLAKALVGNPDIFPPPNGEPATSDDAYCIPTILHIGTRLAVFVIGKVGETD